MGGGQTLGRGKLQGDGEERWVKFWELIGDRACGGRSQAGHLRPAEGPLCVNFSTKMRPQIRDGDAGPRPESAAGQCVEN